MTSESPSRTRYLVLLVTFLAAFLLYLDRFCISFTQQYIKEDLGLTEKEFGLCLSAFFWAYALGQVPSGWLSDRFGARWMLATYIIAWSIFTALLGIAMGFVMLFVLRIGLGLGQAGAYPTCAGLVRNWVPFSGRGKANSFVAFGGRLGGFAAPLLTPLLVVAFVPLGDLSRLENDDLLDVHYLSFQLADTRARSDTGSADAEVERAKQQVRQSVYGSMSADARQALTKLADDYQAEFQRQQEKESADAPNGYDPRVQQHLEAPRKDAEVLLVQLNANIRNADFREHADLDNLPLEREAKSLISLDQLSPQQKERLNRLVLEAVFPKSVRKIYVHGWRPVMFVYGSLGIVVAGLFWFCFRNRPPEHPWCNTEEVALISGTAKETEPKKPGLSAPPFRAMISSRSLWLMCVNQFGGNVGWIFLMTWLPRYLLEVHSVPFIERGWMAAVPLGVGWIGMLAGGWATDWITGRFGLRWRTAPVVMGRTVAMTAYIACIFAPSAWFAVAAFAFIALSNDFCNPSGWSYKQDVGGQHVAAIHGWANMWGNFGAATSPVLIVWVITSFGWTGAFVTGAIAFFIAGSAALGVDARIPIVRD